MWRSRAVRKLHNPVDTWRERNGIGVVWWWYGMGVVWCGVVWCGVIWWWYDIVWYGGCMVWCGVVWCGGGGMVVVRYGGGMVVVWCGVVWWWKGVMW